MNSRMHYYWLSAILFIVITGCTTARKTQHKLNIIRKIIAIQQAQFTNFAKDTVAVSDFRGKVVMSIFGKPGVTLVPAASRESKS